MKIVPDDLGEGNIYGGDVSTSGSEVAIVANHLHFSKSQGSAYIYDIFSEKIIKTFLSSNVAFRRMEVLLLLALCKMTMESVQRTFLFLGYLKVQACISWFRSNRFFVWTARRYIKPLHCCLFNK